MSGGKDGQTFFYRVFPARGLMSYNTSTIFYHAYPKIIEITFIFPELPPSLKKISSFH